MHGRITRIGVQERPRISAPPVTVHQPSERPPTQEQRPATQEQPRHRAPAPLVPPRMPSQRILNKKLSTPVTGPGSSVDNLIIIH